MPRQHRDVAQHDDSRKSRGARCLSTGAQGCDTARASRRHPGGMTTAHAAAHGEGPTTRTRLGAPVLPGRVAPRGEAAVSALGRAFTVSTRGTPSRSGGVLVEKPC